MVEEAVTFHSCLLFYVLAVCYLVYIKYINSEKTWFNLQISNNCTSPSRRIGTNWIILEMVML